MWSDAAQAKTRECAERAGMGRGDRLQIISEPEAAAIYTLDALDPHNVKIGDTFVLCDAGGGTVDLISYTVSALKPMLSVDEAASGTGSLCGSTYLNRIFEQYVIARFGENDGWDDEVIEDVSNHMSAIMEIKAYNPRLRSVSRSWSVLASARLKPHAKLKHIIDEEEIHRKSR